jgi:acetyl-CoA carboxylase carboxyl transferase subunit beta
MDSPGPRGYLARRGDCRMSWLNRVRNSIPFLPKRETAENLWRKCRQCNAMVFTREWEENDFVCPRCDHHGRIGAKARLERVLDPGFTLLPPPQVREDPLKFRDSKRYIDRLKAARAQTGEADALVNARGAIEGRRAVVGVQDFAFMGGSMGLAVGAAFVAGARAAIADNCPYIIFTAAGGARMQEGILSLMQMPRTIAAIAELKENGLPYIVVLTDPTTGGVTASYAMLGDVQIAEPDALIGFAGARVIESTIREKLPEGFQRAEYLLAHGMIDMVVHRKDLRRRLAELIAYLAPEKEAA